MFFERYNMIDNLIYALYCPYTNNPVYIGKTNKGIDRPFMHIKEKSHSNKVNEWVKILKSEGKQPIVVILEHSCPEDLIFDKEHFWILNFQKKGYLLLNQTAITPIIIANQQFDKNYIDDDYSEIRIFIKAKRKQNNLTQKDLADKAGVGIRLIRDLEQGIKINFETNSLNQILHLFGAKLIVGFSK